MRADTGVGRPSVALPAEALSSNSSASSSRSVRLAYASAGSAGTSLMYAYAMPASAASPRSPSAGVPGSGCPSASPGSRRRSASTERWNTSGMLHGQPARAAAVAADTLSADT